MEENTQAHITKPSRETSLLKKAELRAENIGALNYETAQLEKKASELKDSIDMFFDELDQRLQEENRSLTTNAIVLPVESDKYENITIAVRRNSKDPYTVSLTLKDNKGADILDLLPDYNNGVYKMKPSVHRVSSENEWRNGRQVQSSANSVPLLDSNPDDRSSKGKILNIVSNTIGSYLTSSEAELVEDLERISA